MINPNIFILITLHILYLIRQKKKKKTVYVYIQDTDLEATEGVSRVTDGSGLCAWNMVEGVAG